MKVEEIFNSKVKDALHSFGNHPDTMNHIVFNLGRKGRSVTRGRRTGDGGTVMEEDAPISHCHRLVMLHQPSLRTDQLFSCWSFSHRLYVHCLIFTRPAGNKTSFSKSKTSHLHSREKVAGSKVYWVVLYWILILPVSRYSLYQGVTKSF